MSKEASFTIHDLPKPERPRERLKKFGPEALSAQELLSLVIGCGIPKKSVMNIAQELLSRFGNIKAISQATIEELSQIKGIGFAKAAQIKACFELGISTVSIGTLNTDLVHPREVFKEAISHSVASVILAHNYPSGDLEPSEDDLSITKRLTEAGKILGIEVLDHIIVTKNGFFSFKEKGLL